MKHRKRIGEILKPESVLRVVRETSGPLAGLIGPRGPLGGRIMRGAAAVGAALMVLAVAAAPSPAGVASTKHNFGSLSPAEVKTTETTEICVFCHTPHHANPAGPLWNRSESGAYYDVYASATLAATLSPNAPELGQPSGSSKLCLSCHDGTIAIGSLLNLPGKDVVGSLTVTGTGVEPTGEIAQTSTSFIGTDLRDDHPISFDYALSYPGNTEIKDPSTFPPAVKLDNNNMVQCVSCHDPHGTAYPKFLVESVENGALCEACHDKRYWAAMPAAHKTSTALWNGSGQNPWQEDLGAAGYSDDTVQLQSCLACHSSHGGAAGKNLVRGTNPLTQTVDAEEWACLNCHNGNVASADIDSALSARIYTHDATATYGLHTPTRQNPGEPAREDGANLGANRHAECVDCHNGHGLKVGNHTVGGANGNIIGPNLLGGWGVKPFPWGLAGEPATTYQEVDFTTLNPGGDNLEGYLCLKCHSYYAYGFSPPDVPSGGPAGSLTRQSDPTADFNPSNFSFHPVFAQGKNTPPTNANPNWPANTLGLTNTFMYVEYPGVGDRTGFYNVRSTSTITCTDCHSSSVDGDPRGAHGSDEKWILRKNEFLLGTQKNFCYNCHRRDVYGDEGFVGPEANFSRVPHPVDGLGLSSPFYSTGPGLGNDGNKFGNLCLTCHGGSYDTVETVMKGIHGSNAAAGTAGVALGYRMMNGACVETHTPATTTAGVQMTFRSVDTATDEVCNNNYTGFTGVTATYACSNIDDCSF